jgi:hypothetical protein
MSFFAMPVWEPPSGYRIPAWLRPPETMVPGIVPVELLLARTDTDAVLVTDLRAYPTGLEFLLTARPHPDQLQQRRHDPDRPHRFMYRDLWLELRFADGQTVSTHPRSWPHAFETEQPDPPVPLLPRGGWERAWLALPPLAVGPAPARAADLRLHLAGRPTLDLRRGDRRQPGPGGGQSSRVCLADRLKTTRPTRFPGVTG